MSSVFRNFFKKIYFFFGMAILGEIPTRLMQIFNVFYGKSAENPKYKAQSKK